LHFEIPQFAITVERNSLYSVRVADKHDSELSVVMIITQTGF